MGRHKWTALSLHESPWGCPLVPSRVSAGGLLIVTFLTDIQSNFKYQVLGFLDILPPLIHVN